MERGELNRLATKKYGTPRWQTAMAADMKLPRRTVHRWAQHGIADKIKAEAIRVKLKEIDNARE